MTITRRDFIRSASAITAVAAAAPVLGMIPELPVAQAGQSIAVANIGRFTAGDMVTYYYAADYDTGHAENVTTYTVTAVDTETGVMTVIEDRFTHRVSDR